MSVATGRPVLNSAVLSKALVSTSRCHRSCHASSESSWQHWQTPKSTTTVAHALSTNGSAQDTPLQPQARATRQLRVRQVRAGAVGKAANRDLVPLGHTTEHAGTHLPLAMYQARNGSPGASSSDSGAAIPVAGAASSCAESAAEAQVALMRAELREMRHLVTAQAALTAEQELTISGLQRSLRKLSSDESPHHVGTQGVSRPSFALECTQHSPMRHTGSRAMHHLPILRLEHPSPDARDAACLAMVAP